MKSLFLYNKNAKLQFKLKTSIKDAGIILNFYKILIRFLYFIEK
jgi:hypothetical protein